MIEHFVGEVVVVDLRSSYVCIGTLHRLDDHFVEIRDADLHDLRDSATTREEYVATSRLTGVKRNRKKLFLVRSEIVAMSALKDVVDE